MAKKPELTLDEENEEKAKYGGVTKKDLLAADRAIGEAQSESSEISGNLSAALGLFEKKGGRKDALKFVSKWVRRESSDFADFYRAFVGYGMALGLLGDDGKPSQLDMLDQEEEREKNADSIESATIAAAKTAAKPQIGAEPVH